VIFRPDTILFGTVFEKGWWIAWFFPSSFLGLLANLYHQRVNWDEKAVLLEDNRKLLHRTLNAEENERRRVAEELHDLVCQDLITLQQHCKEAQPLVGHPKTDEIARLVEHLDTIQFLGKHAYSQIRGMMTRLWPDSL